MVTPWPRSSSRRAVSLSFRFPWAWLAVVFIALLGCGATEPASGPVGADSASPDSPAWIEALAFAREGQAALESGREVDARARLRTAVGVLYRAGILDDVPRSSVERVALERLDQRLGPGSRLAQQFKTLDPPPPSTEGPKTCPLVAANQEVDRACVEAGLRWLLQRLRQPDPVLPASFVDRVAQTIESESKSILRAKERGAHHIPMIEGTLQSRHLSPLLHYLALVESGYRVDALSHADAAGLWQFIRTTARSYGLRIDQERDERLDPKRSTEAAAEYLQDLSLEFGGESLFLGLAAYNAGSGRVRAALHQLDDPFADRSYWRLVERGLLPEETARYVARFLAAALVGELGLTSE